MIHGEPTAFRNPMINIYSHDLVRLASFYESLGFRETFRTPRDGAPVHVEVGLDDFTIGIASVDAAAADHGLSPDLGGRPIEIVLWSDDVDRDHARLTEGGAPSLSPPHDFPTVPLRAAWVADPDGNPIQLVQRRREIQPTSIRSHSTPPLPEPLGSSPRRPDGPGASQPPAPSTP